MQHALAVPCSFGSIKLLKFTHQSMWGFRQPPRRKDAIGIQGLL